MTGPLAAGIPPLLAGLADDAAIFPPGSLPLEQAVAAHLRHRAAPYAAFVGPLVLSAAVLPQLPAILARHPGAQLSISVTVPAPADVAGVLAQLPALAQVQLAALEVALPAELAVADVVPALDAALPAAAPPVYVEVPRDDRRPGLLEVLAASKHRAKFRTGGVAAHLYPDEAELAAALEQVAALRLPFKATAGLHHAVRNTDPATGFEQHGFLNLLLAAAAALGGAPAGRLAQVLASRDGDQVARDVAALPAEAARSLFVSFGTCSVTDPLTDLVAAGLLPADLGAHP